MPEIGLSGESVTWLLVVAGPIAEQTSCLRLAVTPFAFWPATAAGAGRWVLENWNLRSECQRSLLIYGEEIPLPPLSGIDGEAFH